MKVLVLMTVIALAGAQDTASCPFRDSLEGLGFKPVNGRLLETFSDADDNLQMRCLEACCLNANCTNIGVSAGLGLGDALGVCELWTEVEQFSQREEFPDWNTFEKGDDIPEVTPPSAATASAEASLVTLVLPMAVAVILYLNSVLVQ